jgi:hypothetical protein
MNLLYRDEFLEQTLFAKCLHRYDMNHPNARAVRNRKTYLSAKIVEVIKSRGVEKDIKILSLACGPAEELTELFKPGKKILFNPERLHIHLLDQDVEALKLLKPMGSKIDCGTEQNCKSNT